MTNEQAYKILSEHQAWHNNDNILHRMPHSPWQVDEATNVALQALQGWQRIDEQLPPIDAPVWTVELSGKILLVKRVEMPDMWFWAEVCYPIYLSTTKTIEGTPKILDIEPIYWHAVPEMPVNMFACFGE